MKMFASLKNKIREETGSDISKLTAKITTSTVQKIDSIRGKSHHGSSSSINSLVSSEGIREDATSSFTEPDEVKRRMNRMEAEFIRKLDQKELEWREVLSAKDKFVLGLEKEKEDALRQVAVLRESLKTAEDYKRRLVDHQEDKDQFESFQVQELSKVKHLVLQRDQELADKSAALKEAMVQLEKLRSEVMRLRRQEEQLSDVQDDLESLRHSTARDLAALATDLARSEEERRHLSDLVAILRQRVANETTSDEHFVSERRLLEHRLEEAHLHLADIKTSWSDKIASLETQVGRLSRQAAEESCERRRAVEEMSRYGEKVRQLEAELECGRLDLNNKENKIMRLTADLEELSVEIKGLRSESEEEVTFLKTQLQNAQVEVKAVRKNLENTEGELDKMEDERSRLKLSVDSEQKTSSSLRQVLAKLERELAEERSNSLNVQKTLSRVTTEKNTALLRNAEISQQMELVKQEKRRQEHEMTDLHDKLSQLESEVKKYQESRTLEQQLRGTIAELEDQMCDKNKNIKTLQLRLADMKKTLQQELKTTPGNHLSSGDFFESSAAILAPSQVSTFPSVVKRDEDDVNFKYLKHVVIKFLTSREYEAQHLIKAIATVLQFNAEEERLVNETLEWKRSWFGGSKPKLGNGQKARRTSNS